MPEIDQRLIDVCNELDFVLICLPPKNFAHRYSELISEVLFEVFREQERNRFFVSALLDRDEARLLFGGGDMAAGGHAHHHGCL